MKKNVTRESFSVETSLAFGRRYDLASLSQPQQNLQASRAPKACADPPTPSLDNGAWPLRAEEELSEERSLSSNACSLRRKTSFKRTRDGRRRQRQKQRRERVSLSPRRPSSLQQINTKKEDNERKKGETLVLRKGACASVKVFCLNEFFVFCLLLERNSAQVFVVFSLSPRAFCFEVFLPPSPSLSPLLPMLSYNKQKREGEEEITGFTNWL